MRYVGLALGAAVLAGCVTSAHGPSFAEAQVTPPTSNEDAVYIFRNDVLYLAQAPYIVRSTILIDGQPVGTVANGGFIVANVRLGRHYIVATSGTEKTVRIFDTVPGAPVYVQVYDRTRMEGARAVAGGAGGAVGGAVGGASSTIDGSATPDKRTIARAGAAGAIVGAAAGAQAGFRGDGIYPVAALDGEVDGRLWALGFDPPTVALPILSKLHLSE